METRERIRWATTPGSVRLQAALAKDARWWVRPIAIAVLVGLVAVVGNELCAGARPAVVGGEALKAAPTQLPHPGR